MLWTSVSLELHNQPVLSTRITQPLGLATFMARRRWPSTLAFHRTEATTKVPLCMDSAMLPVLTMARNLPTRISLRSSLSKMMMSLIEDLLSISRLSTTSSSLFLRVLSLQASRKSAHISAAMTGSLSTRSKLETSRGFAGSMVPSSKASSTPTTTQIPASPRQVHLHLHLPQLPRT